MIMTKLRPSHGGEKEKEDEEEKDWGLGLVSEEERRLQTPGEHGSQPQEGHSGAAAQGVWGPG